MAIRKKTVRKASVCAVMGCMVIGAQTMQAGAAPTDAEKALVGQRAFAQCEEYINIRKEASKDSEVVAKIYPNGMATILDAENGWYRIRSGNAEGYVSGEYFATGEAADRIAETAAYNVAKIHPEVLNIRTEPNEDSGVLGAARQNEELEVVAYDGDWMKVALGQDVFGYVNAYYVDYLTYYPQAETLEEEQARLQAEAQNRSEAEPEYREPEYNEPEYSEPEYSEPEYTEPETPEYSEPEYSEPEYSEPEYSESEYSEPEYSEPETPEYSEPEYSEPEYSEPEYSEPEYSEPEYSEPEYSEPEYSEPEYTEPETPEYSEPEYTEPETPEYSEPEYSEPEETESAAGTGQQIVDYATQFVGNPYVWGGTSLTNGADCSGFTQSVFANFGIGLSRTAASQSGGGSAVSLDNIQAGDLLFYSDGSGISHVAIYMGGGQIVHAANASTGITISNAYYSTPVSASRYW